MTDLLLDLYYVDVLLTLRKVTTIILMGSIIVSAFLFYAYLLLKFDEDETIPSYKSLIKYFMKMLKITSCIAVIATIVFIVVPDNKFLDLKYSTLSEQYLESVKNTESEVIILELPENE